MPLVVLLRWLPILVAWIVASLIAQAVAFRVLGRLTRRSAFSAAFRDRCRRPARLLALFIGWNSALSSVHLRGGSRAVVCHLASLGLIGVGAWLIVEAGFVGEDMVLRPYVEVTDNLQARKKRTQILVLRRVTVAVVAVIAGAAMLTTFHEARVLGTSLLASAGIVGLAAGTAARPSLANLAAGIEIAFTEPIRIDDVVGVEGEWGRVEEITLTYVVVRLWDARRLVMPISYFVQNPFQNWTRSTADLLASAYFHLDYQVPMEELRAAFETILDNSEGWDRRLRFLQVTDASERTIEVRAVMSAADSPTVFDLRCEVREALIGWLQANHPEALPRTRTELVSAMSDQASAV